jgi:arsenate reductase
MPTIVIYQKPTCSTCRQVYAILKEAGVDFESVDYYTDPIPRNKLKELLRKMKMPARDLLRTKEPLFRELGLDAGELPEEKALDLMTRHPELLQRPIVEKGPRAILARPAERIRELL